MLQVNEVKHLGSRMRLYIEHEMLRLRLQHDTFEGHRASFLPNTHRAPLAKRGHYPFSAPAMMPSMNWRCMNTKTATTGTVASVAPARTVPYSLP